MVRGLLLHGQGIIPESVVGRQSCTAIPCNRRTTNYKEEHYEPEQSIKCQKSRADRHVQRTPAAVLETIQVAVPFAPRFYKLDFAELPVLIGGFAMGPPRQL